MSLKNELTSITKSAFNQKWYQAERALGRAFWRIDLHHAMQIMVTFMKTHLVNVEVHSPELSWAAVWLDVLETLKPIGFTKYQFDFWGNYDTTKLSTLAFLQGLGWSNGAYSWYIGAPHEAERYMSMCTDALAPAVGCTISARLFVYMEESHPEIYENYQQQFQISKPVEDWTQEELDKTQKIMRLFKEASFEKHRDLWLEVVQLFRVIPKSSEDN